MATKWAGSKLSDFDRKAFELLDPARAGGRPAVPIVPYKPGQREEKATTFSYRTSKMTKVTLNQFPPNGTDEMALSHVLNTWGAVDKDLGLTKSLEDNDAEIEKQQKIIDEFDANSMEDDEITKQEKAFTKRDKAKGENEKTEKKLFDTFGSMLHPDLLPRWNEVVANECDEIGYIEDNVRVTDRARGRTRSGFEASQRAWLRLNMKDNTAERQRAYLEGMIKMPRRKVSVDVFVERVLEINKLLAVMPTLKDLENAPAELPRGDVPFKGLRLCQIIIRALPKEYQEAYYALKGEDHLPVDIEQLRKDLRTIEPQFRQTQAILDKVNESKAIPRKPKANGSGKDDKTRKTDAASSAGGKKESKYKKYKNDRDGTKPRSARFCARCAKKSPQYKETHNTKDCRLWDEDLNPKNKRAFHLAKKDDSSDDEATAAAYYQQKREVKKLRKEIKTLKKKRSSKRKRRYDDSSSDSSGSDSE